MLSIVLPSYNESKNIQNAYIEIKKVLSKAKIPFELVYVNDGSKDDTDHTVSSAPDNLSCRWG